MAKSWYTQSAEELLQFRQETVTRHLITVTEYYKKDLADSITDVQEVAAHTDKQRHDPVISTVARGVIELKKH